MGRRGDPGGRDSMGAKEVDWARTGQAGQWECRRAGDGRTGLAEPESGQDGIGGMETVDLEIESSEGNIEGLLGFLTISLGCRH